MDGLIKATRSGSNAMYFHRKCSVDEQSVECLSLAESVLNLTAIARTTQWNSTLLDVQQNGNSTCSSDPGCYREASGLSEGCPTATLMTPFIWHLAIFSQHAKCVFLKEIKVGNLFNMNRN